MDLHSDPGSLSFFNLQIELLIEGMPDADKCSDYKYHEERGYRDTYFTQVDYPSKLSSSRVKLHIQNISNSVHPDTAV